VTTFNEAVLWLNERGIGFRQGDEYVGEVGVDRRCESRPWIESIEVPFSAEEWLDIISADSKIFGSCCATISNARDILYAQARHGRWIDGKDLWEFVEILSHHDGFEFMLPRTNENHREWSSWCEGIEPQDDPIYRLWEVYDKVKNHLKIEVPHTEPYPEGAPIREPIQRALSTLNQSLDALYWATSCFASGREDDPQWMKDQRRAARQRTIARLMPALHELIHHIDDLDLGDFEGYAVVQKDEPDVLCKNGLGACIYTTEDDAKEMIARWAKTYDERKEPAGRMASPRESTAIRPVRVSSKTGLTFLDEENP